MELHQLRYVLAVAETQNFTRAAEQCYVVQSALSHQIKHLENELGVKLFARTSRRVELTEAGRAFLPGARACLEAAERAAADAAAADGRIRGRLTIGVIPTVGAIHMPSVLRDFHLAYPEVRITLHEASSDTLIAAIDDGKVDVALLGLPESDPARRVRTRELARDRHVAVMSTAHRLADRTSLHLSELMGETFADFPAGSPGRAQTDLAFENAHLQRTVAFEAADPALVVGLIEQNLAIALLPSVVAPVRSDLVRIPLVDGPTRIEYLAWSLFNPSPAAAAFIEVVAAALPPTPHDAQTEESPFSVSSPRSR